MPECGHDEIQAKTAILTTKRRGGRAAPIPAESDIT
jgi:hypothetical protein